MAAEQRTATPTKSAWRCNDKEQAKKGSNMKSQGGNDANAE
jgi:hypothetical protein